MRTVNTVSLNGNAWQIECEGCDALAAYLRGAEARLAADPDRDEIIADLEQAIADKLARYVSASKNVVTAAEIGLALAEMGPVETGAPEPGRTQAPGPQPAAGPAPQPNFGARHLYQIREGAMISGVCRGLAAYFGIDVTLVRVIFVVFAVLTGGIGAVIYLVMMIVVPVAVTSEQMAAAHGKPFSAEELIGRSQATFDAGRHWRQQWRDQRRMWRDQRRMWKRARHGWAAYPGMPPAPPPPPPFYGTPGIGLAKWILFIGFLVALSGAADGRPLMGWNWAGEVPVWVGIVTVCVLYGTLHQQLNIARYYGYVGVHHPGHALLALFGTLVWLAVLGCVGWYVVHHWPQVQDFLQHALRALQAAFDDKPSGAVAT